MSWLGGNETIFEELPITKKKNLKHEGFKEAIPKPDMTKFSQSNVKAFTHETKLTETRGEKFNLTPLFLF
ncbi:hypothetical protein L916_05837 [Phytophthora nicotianae]|nr:hypothetical protein L916_05837 [Phytophthora nicotianae]